MEWSFTFLMTLPLPSWFYCLPYDFFTLHNSSYFFHVLGLTLYNTFRIRIYIIHKMIWHMVTHDMTWHNTNEMEIYSHSWCFLLYVFLRMIFLPPSNGLEMRSLQCYKVLSCGRKMMSLFYMLVNKLAFLAIEVSSIMFFFSISFFIILA